MKGERQNRVMVLSDEQKGVYTMRRFYSFGSGIRRTLPALFLLIITFAFASTACGAAVGSTGSTGSGSASAPTVNPTSTGVPNPTTAEGCPTSATITTPVKATITVTDSSKDATVNAHTGDVIEFRFPFGKKWSGPKASQGGLDLQGPAGYVSKVNSTCTWDFTAKSTGTTQLAFNSQPLCKRGELCPHYIATFPFTVQVK